MKFSIIIPIYFYNDFVENMFKSISKQKLKDIDTEILVIGNSITLQEFEKLKLKIDPIFEDSKIEIVYLHTEKKGANYSRMLGFNNSKAEYVFFMDSDDQFSNSDVLFKMNEIINTCKPDVITVNIQHAFYNENDELELGKIIYNYKHSDKYLLKNGNIKLLTKSFGTNICARFIKRELLEGINFLDLPYTQDWNISSKLYSRVNSFYFVNVPFYIYIYRKNSISQVVSMSFESHKETFNSIIDIIKFYKENKLDKINRYFLNDRIIKFCFLYISKSSYFDINEGFERANKLIKREINYDRFFFNNLTVLKMFILIKSKFLYKIYLKKNLNKKLF